MMLKEWRKFRGYRVLEFFIRTNERIHIKGLVRRLKISPRTAQMYLNLYEKEGLLERERLGNLSIYRLKTTPLTREIKKVYFLLHFFPEVKNIVKDNPDIITIALYGSHASGEYDQTSDIDLLILSQKKTLNLESVKNIERKMKKEVRIQVLSIGEWKTLLKKCDLFALSILRNHIILHGAQL